MSKCWYCNNELTSGDNQKHFGICNKCYDEMFKNGDAIIRSLTNKIAELEKQLEEKEKLLQYGMTKIKNLHKRINDIVKRDEKLFKSQPAEIVEKIKKRLCDRLNIIAGYGQMTIDEFSFFVESEFTKDIDDILKEYQK